MSENSAIISHWHYLLEGYQQSSQEFYQLLNQAITFRQIPKIKLHKTSYNEGGLLSTQREYLRVSRKELVFDICAAPFANSFFISWWLTEKTGCISQIPILGHLIRFLAPVTYFKHDTAIMFQELVHSAVMEVIDGITKTKGLRSLSESERKPMMPGFLK